MSDGGNGEVDEEEAGEFLTREEYLWQTANQTAVERLVAILHMESTLDSKAATERIDSADMAAATAVKIGLIGVQTSMPELLQLAIHEIASDQQEGSTDLRVVGEIPKPDLTVVHAANPERRFTECGVALPYEGIVIGSGIAQVTCKGCITKVKLTFAP
jgi:hypothetical protein